ncbi:lysine N(6)-hydroxylase/L-ornithine N(5)-oxygenase family protein [Bradyrhizobium prioriisuperbiae]|uniref:lysine N(6)-hydroxylase/L-ornithine N(5)-oxygenase family protein n=1 Tax=Bradyrhizobium prioriisuperbiae TaxID=2854389 RepID=UPI0028F08308|nr:SidA/IucD/PvdA family monooxygenase [Bradyrhizobium prioritasuperba]
MTRQIFDIIGIGFGPANIALAAALEERRDRHSVLFLEKADEPAWQPGMLLGGSDIQNNPLRDLVTPRNPRSRYSFTNFLHEQGRLFEYLNLGIEFPLRKEYAQYVVWVARNFDRWVRYGRDVADISVDVADGRAIFIVSTHSGETFAGRSLIAAPGRTPLIPEQFTQLMGDRVVHLTGYLPTLQKLTRNGPLARVCVVGGSQSAVELVLDLSARLPGAEIVNVQRGFGFALKDTSPFSDHVYFPEHVDYYFNASPRSKAIIDAQLKRTNYSSADGDVIHRLYLTMYEQKLDGDPRIKIHANTRITGVTQHADELVLGLEEVHRHDRSELRTDLVVLATGFRNLGPGISEERLPQLLAPIADRLATNEAGVLNVARDYRLHPSRSDATLPPIYLNGLCESSHGMGDAGSFSLLSLRAELIAQSLDAALAGAGHDASLLQAS